jgi:hypothetical protein
MVTSSLRSRKSDDVSSCMGRFQHYSSWTTAFDHRESLCSFEIDGPQSPIFLSCMIYPNHPVSIKA